MPILSSSTIKAYIKKNQRIAFHLNSHLLIETTRYFESTELSRLQGSFTLSYGDRIEFDKISWVVSETDYDYSFNGYTKVIQFHLSKVIEFKSLESSVASLEIIYTLQSKISKIQTQCLLRKMYDERFFED